jgi:hypothetical protein
MRERANTIKHFKAKEVSNFGLSKEESTHPLHSSWTPRPKCIQICPPNIDQEQRVDTTLRIRKLPLKTEKGTGVTFKGTEKVISWTGTKKIVLLTWGGHIMSVLIYLAIY